MRVRKDKHHIIHHGLEWSMRPQALAIRETPSLIPAMPRDYHEYIHATVPAIPLLGYHALNHTLSRFKPNDDTLETMDNLMSAIEHASRHPKAHAVERDLAQLAIHAIDLQRPLIEDLHSTRKRILIA